MTETARRQSAVLNAHRRMKMFTWRDDPAGRPVQYERIFIALVQAGVDVSFRVFRAGEPI